jgi:hypothetical protein
MKLEEGSLEFTFDGFSVAERFDTNEIYGLKAVDFFAETTDRIFFIEIKDYQNPKATKERKQQDFEMLFEAIEPKKKTVFTIEMGQKIKDSLLREYASEHIPRKKICYLLLINLDKYGERERGLLKEKIRGHVPTGLNNNAFSGFSEITFELVNREQLQDYGIICTQKTE